MQSNQIFPHIIRLLMLTVLSGMTIMPVWKDFTIKRCKMQISEFVKDMVADLNQKNNLLKMQAEAAVLNSHTIRMLATPGERVSGLCMYAYIGSQQEDE